MGSILLEHFKNPYILETRSEFDKNGGANCEGVRKVCFWVISKGHIVFYQVFFPVNSSLIKLKIRKVLEGLCSCCQVQDAWDKQVPVMCNHHIDH